MVEPAPPNKTTLPWPESYAIANAVLTGGLVCGDCSVQLGGIWASAAAANNIGSIEMARHFAILMVICPLTSPNFATFVAP